MTPEISDDKSKLFKAILDTAQALEAMSSLAEESAKVYVQRAKGLRLLLAHQGEPKCGGTGFTDPQYEDSCPGCPDCAPKADKFANNFIIEDCRSHFIIKDCTFHPTLEEFDAAVAARREPEAEEAADHDPIRAARNDARLLGSGYLRIDADGSYTRIAPESISFSPSTPSGETAQSNQPKLEPWSVPLPAITRQMFEDYRYSELIVETKAGYEWTQDAVDFAAMLQVERSALDKVKAGAK
jgi:hypothetical protein